MGGGNSPTGCSPSLLMGEGRNGGGENSQAPHPDLPHNGRMEFTNGLSSFSLRWGKVGMGVEKPAKPPTLTSLTTEGWSSPTGCSPSPLMGEGRNGGGETSQAPHPDLPHNRRMEFTNGLSSFPLRWGKVGMGVKQPTSQFHPQRAAAPITIATCCHVKRPAFFGAH